MLSSKPILSRSFMQSKSAIFGFGVVGQVTAKAFEIDYAFDWDNIRHKYKPMGEYDLSVLKECEEVWISVPTPTDSKGHCDIKAVVAIALMLASSKLFPKLVVRSTVIPGTSEYLRKLGFDVVSYPEFLSDLTAEEDMKNPWFCVVGGKTQTVDAFFDKYIDYFGDKNFCPMDNVSAELTKYAVNSLFATLVTFGNQIYDASQQARADYQRIKWVLSMLPWSKQHHLEVMHKGYRGYGGKCLPKDTLALAKTFGLPLLKNVHSINQKYLQHNYSRLQPKRRNRASSHQSNDSKLRPKVHGNNRRGRRVNRRNGRSG